MQWIRHSQAQIAVAILGALIFALPASAADPVSGAVLINPADVKWVDVPPNLPKGAKLAVLHGDLGKSGPIVVRMRAPAGYKVPPHWHSQTENLTVVSGTLYVGMGDKVDAQHAHAVKAGGFHVLPAKVHHYVFTKVPTVVQLHGEGPLDTTYVNPADDPQRSAKK